MADNAKKNILTYAGLQELEAELEDLKVNKRKEVAQKIKEAREQGDLSENAEYDAAKDEQRDIEARIEEIEKILKNVEVVGEDDIDDAPVILTMVTGKAPTYIALSTGIIALIGGGIFLIKKYVI